MIQVINESITYNDFLNPKIWTENAELKKDVRDRILLIVKEFSEYIDIDIDILDIYLLGSNAGYNYTHESDLDVHIIANFSSLSKDTSNGIIQALYNAERSSFNNSHDISINGISVEVYVEDITTSTVSNGVFSIYKDKWIVFPKKQKQITVDFEPELSEIRNKVLNVISSSDSKKMKKMLDNLYLMRKEGLMKRGEQSKGNQIFKELRSGGILELLRDTINSTVSRELSL